MNDRRSHLPVLAWPLSILLVAVIGCVDYLTGHQIEFSVFYFLPVALAAWHLGTVPAAGAAIICAVVTFVADHLSGRVYANNLIAVWNDLIFLCAFLTVAFTVARIRELLKKERETSAALVRSSAELRVLEGLLPICASCKKIRDDEGQWQQIERYIGTRTGAQFTHGVCPGCARKLIEEAGLPWDEKWTDETGAPES